MGVVGALYYFTLSLMSPRYYVLYVFYLFILLGRILYCATLARYGEWLPHGAGRLAAT